MKRRLRWGWVIWGNKGQSGRRVLKSPVEALVKNKKVNCLWCLMSGEGKKSRTDSYLCLWISYWAKEHRFLSLQLMLYRKEGFRIKRIPRDCLIRVTHTSSWHPGSFTTHAQVPLGHGRVHPKPHRLWQPLLLSTVTRSRVLGLSSSAVPAEACTRVPRQVWRRRCLPICSASCRCGQAQTCLQRCTSVCRMSFSDVWLL